MALKLLTGSGSFLSKDSYDQFFDGYANQQLAPLVAWDQQGVRVEDPAALGSTHVDIISSVLPLDEIQPPKGIN